MIDVRITYVGLVQRLVGCSAESVSLPHESTLAGLLQALVVRYGKELGEALLENGELAAHATILINGQKAPSHGGLEAKLGDGSQSQVEIVLLGPPLIGG